MAVGNESDLKVIISVNTEEVQKGFNQIVSMTDALVRDIESRLSKLDFSRVFDTSKISSSISSAIGEVAKEIKPIEIKTKVKAPKVPAGKVVSVGGMASLEEVKGRISRGKEAVEDSKAASAKQTHAQAIATYVRALREQAAAMEKVLQLQQALDRTSPDDEIRGKIESAIALWRKRADMFGSISSSISGKYGARKWFSDSEQVKDTKTKLEATEAERAARKEEDEHIRTISEYVSTLNEEARALERIKDLRYELSKVDPEKQPELYASIQGGIAMWQSRASSYGAKASSIASANAANAWFTGSRRISETREALAIKDAEKDITLEKRKQADLAAEKAREEREALEAIAAANQLYRIASSLIRRIASAFRGWVEISNNIYQSQLKLGAALRVGNELSNAQVRATYEMVENLSKANGLSLEMNYSASQMLASYVGSSEELETMLNALDDLVIKIYGYNATSEQATMMAKQLGRALSGNVDILQRQGVVLSDNEKALLKSSSVSSEEKIKVLVDAIARRTGDMSQEAKTWAGTMGRIRVYGEIIKNNFGEALQNALKPMLDIILGIANGMAKISEWSIAISRFAFGDNIKGAEEMSGAIADIVDELDALQSRLLGFDKFNVLSGSDADYSSILGGGKASGADDGASEQAEGLSDVAEFWLEALGPMEAAKVALTGIAVSLGTIVALSAAMMAAGYVAKLKNLVSTLNLASKGIQVTKSNIGMLAAGITLLTAGVTTLVSTFDDLNNWDELTGWQKATTIFKLLIGSLMTFAGAVMTISSLVKIFGDTSVVSFLKAQIAALKLNVSLMPLISKVAKLALWMGALAAAAVGIYSYVSVFNELSTASKVLIPLIAVVAGLAAAFIALRVAQAGWAAAVQAAMIAGGIAMAVGSMAASTGSAGSKAASNVVSSLASGGMPDKGQLFIANEAGPELVGTIGGHTSVANNAMIVEAIEEAAYRGFSRANEGGSNGNVTLKIDGDAVRNDALVRALMPALKTEVRRQGGLKKAFGGE